MYFCLIANLAKNTLLFLTVYVYNLFYYYCISAIFLFHKTCFHISRPNYRFSPVLKENNNLITGVLMTSSVIMDEKLLMKDQVNVRVNVLSTTI